MLASSQIANAQFTSLNYVASLFVAIFLSVCVFLVLKGRLSNPWLGFGLMLILIWIACVWITRSEFSFDGKQVSYRHLFARASIQRESIKDVGVQEGQGAFLPLPSPTVVIVTKPGSAIQGYIYSIDYFSLGQAKRWAKVVTEYSPN
jgi:hypothetical protein